MHKTEQPVIETERLILRPFKLGDKNAVHQLAGNKRVSETTLNIPHPYEIEMAEEWISSHKNGWADKSSVNFAIVEKLSNKLLGAIGIADIKSETAELGYWIGEPYWSHGFCTEAAKAVINFAFQSLCINKICAEHLIHNPASGWVMQKTGMHYVRTTRTRDRYSELSQVNIYEIKKALN